MNTRTACIVILCFGGASLLLSSVQSCSKHKGGWSSGDEGHKTDFTHLDNLDASQHPTLSEKIKWVIKDHYIKGKAHKHGEHGHDDHKPSPHGHSGGHVVGSGLGYGFGAGGHHHQHHFEGGHHGGVAWSPPKHGPLTLNSPIVIQKGSIAPLNNYQPHQQNHHEQEHRQQNYYNNPHHDNEGDDERQNEIDHPNNDDQDDHYEGEYSQGPINKYQNAPPVQANKFRWGPPRGSLASLGSLGSAAQSYQYAAHNSNVVPRVLRPDGISSKVSKYMQLEKIRHALGIKPHAA